MPKTAEQITAELNAVIHSKGWDAPPQPDDDADVYLVFPDHTADFSFVALLRYGNWVGPDYGARCVRQRLPGTPLVFQQAGLRT